MLRIWRWVWGNVGQKDSNDEDWVSLYLREFIEQVNGPEIRL